MTVRYSTGAINRALGDNAVSGVNNGLAGIFKNSYIEIYTGTQPASADNAATGTLLARVTNNGGAFSVNSPTNGLQFNPPSGGAITKATGQTWQYEGLAVGVAGWARLCANDSYMNTSSNTDARMDMAVGSSTGDLQISNVNIIIGTQGSITEFTITGS